MSKVITWQVVFAMCSKSQSIGACAICSQLPLLMCSVSPIRKNQNNPEILIIYYTRQDKVVQKPSYNTVLSLWSSGSNNNKLVNYCVYEKNSKVFQSFCPTYCILHAVGTIFNTGPGGSGSACLHLPSILLLHGLAEGMPRWRQLNSYFLILSKQI